MDKRTAINLAREYSELVRHHMPVCQVVLYGSQAKETAHPDSDIDVAVVVERVDGDYLDALASLFRLRREIDLRIEPVLIVQGNDRSGFLSEIMATGHVVYESAPQAIANPRGNGCSVHAASQQRH